MEDWQDLHDWAYNYYTSKKLSQEEFLERVCYVNSTPNFKKLISENGRDEEPTDDIKIALQYAREMHSKDDDEEENGDVGGEVDEEWKDLYEWAYNFRKKENLTKREFLHYICQFEQIPHKSLKYLSKNGKQMALAENGDLRNALIHAKMNFDAQLENNDVRKLKEQLVPEPSFQENFDNLIVVDNLPVVDHDKYARLLSVIHKIYVQFDGSITKEKIILPTDPSTKMTKGYAFIEFSAPKLAETAIDKTDNYKLDRNHIFKVSSFSDFARYEKVPEVFAPPPLNESNFKENLRWWVSNPNEQFVLRYADETEVFWYDTISNVPKSIIKKNKWTEKYVEWSTYGSYLATIHTQGFILWGGENWTRIHRIPHLGIVSLQFSPQEKYIVSFSHQYLKEDNRKDPQCYVVWHAASGKKCRGFPHTEDSTGSAVNPWPVFKWSHDDKYFARMITKDKQTYVSVFETPSMNLINHVHIPNVKAFEWSPSSHIFVCWTEESTNTPAKVIVYSIPTCTVLIQKTYFSVKDCSIHWQDQGKYFCVKINRYLKKNKAQTSTSFEIFSAKEKDFPTEVLALPEKEKVIAFNWEPKGNRFAIIHADQSAHTRFSVSFYQYTLEKLELLKKLENKPANLLLWSPLGSYILLAGIKDNLGGALEFYNVDMLESMGENSHDTASRVAWDPSGRFVTTTSSVWDKQPENGFIVWSFKGDQVHKLMKDKFGQFLWRPRPPTLLSPEKEEEIKSKLKDYTKKYRKVVKAGALAASNSQQALRDIQQKEFDALIRKWNALNAEEKARRAQIRGYASDDDMVEVEYEEILSTETIE